MEKWYQLLTSNITALTEMEAKKKKNEERKEKKDWLMRHRNSVRGERRKNKRKEERKNNMHRNVMMNQNAQVDIIFESIRKSSSTQEAGGLLWTRGQPGSVVNWRPTWTTERHPFSKHQKQLYEAHFHTESKLGIIICYLSTDFSKFNPFKIFHINFT